MIYALCVWAKSTHALFLREWSAFILSLFSVGKSSALGCPFFSRELGRSSAPRGSGTAAAEAVKRLSTRRSQMELANEFREEFFISRSTAADESELREEDVLSVTSSYPAGSALLAHGGQKKAERIFLSLLSLSAPRCRAAGGYEACAYIYIYAFSRRFYPKRLTFAFRLYIFISTCVPWESNPQPFVQQCSTTEPHRNTLLLGKPTVESMLRPPLLRAPIPGSSVARLPLI